MIRQRTTLELKGLTIATVILAANNERMAIVFTDESFVVLTANYGYDLVNLECDTSPFDAYAFGSPQAIEAGILTQAEADEQVEARRQSIEMQTEQLQRAEYERLKRKFG